MAKGKSKKKKRKREEEREYQEHLALMRKYDIEYYGKLFLFILFLGVCIWMALDTTSEPPVKPTPPGTKIGDKYITDSKWRSMTPEEKGKMVAEELRRQERLHQ